MKICYTAFLALLAMEKAFAFVPNTNNFRHPSLVSVRSMVKEAPAGTDVSIPYDAAARLAYDEWRTQFNKGSFDDKRFEIFKANYEIITVANVSAKKKARDDGTSSLTLMSLNEYGDLTEEEYKKILSSGSKTISTGDVLSKAVENAELQSEASSALSEAADALAEEEKKLAEQLGLNSVEELEVALDSLEGIAPDGGELEPDNIAREARIRDAYLKWCKDYKKTPDESRFPTFSNNFLLMEQYAKETNKEMNLNEYADFTKEEYEALQGKTELKEEEKKTKVEEKLKEVAAQAAETVEEQLKQAADALRLAALALGDEKELDEAQREIRRLENEKAERENAKAREQRSKEIAERAKAEAERRKVIEQERAERLKQQEALKVKQQAELEASIIAVAKIEEARQAKAAAQRAKVEAEAAALARKQAQEWEVKQRRAAEISAAGGKAPPKLKKKAAPSFLSFFSAPPATQTKPVVPKPAPVPERTSIAASKATKAAEKTSPFSFISTLVPEAKKTVETPKPAPAPAPKVVVSAPKPSFSFFSIPAPAPAEKKLVVSKSLPVVAPAPKKEAPSPFSFFKAPAPAPKPAVKVAAPAPVTETKKPAFSFFASTPKEPKSATKPDIKVPNKQGSINLFGATPKAAVKPDVKVPNRPGTISIFGANKPAPKKDTPVPNRGGTLPVKKTVPEAQTKGFSFFGSPKTAAPNVVEPPPTPVKAKPTFSLFGAQSDKPKSASPAVKAPPKNIPILSRWKQNADGSITGKVSNSPNFKAGTQITTSPVAKGAKAGSIVKTGSGSQYYLG